MSVCPICNGPGVRLDWKRHLNTQCAACGWYYTVRPRRFTRAASASSCHERRRLARRLARRADRRAAIDARPAARGAHARILE